MAFTFQKLFEDTFQRANENPLSDGGSWATSPGYPGLTPTPCQLVSDACEATATLPTSALNASYLNVALPGNQYAQFTLGNYTGPSGAGDNFVGVFLRSNAAGNSALEFVFARKEQQLLVIESVSGTILSETLLSFLANPGDVILCFCSGMKWYVYRNGTPTASGQISELVSGLAQLVFIINGSLTDITITDFQAGGVMPSFFRYDGTVQDPQGLAIAGASIAVLGEPESFATQPGSPLEQLYAEPTSNSATITGASWQGGQLTFTLSSTPPSDVVEGSFIAVSGVTPSAFDSTVSEPYLVLSVVGNQVTVAALANPGTYLSGGTVATSALPNPTVSDGNGRFFFYISAGIYAVQIYGDTITEVDLPDQAIGTVAGGSVSSVGLTMPAIFTVGGSPVTSSGTLAVTLANQSANLVFAGPSSGSPGAPTFRALVSADIPGGVGTVSSVAHTLTVPTSILTASVSGSPIITSGTLADTLTLVNQTANQVWAGPTSGSAAPPTFRALVPADYAPTNTLFSGSSDAISAPGVYSVDSIGVDAMTLFAPTSAYAGQTVTVVSITSSAHTIAAGSNNIFPSHSTVTFSGAAGDYVILQCVNKGLAYVWFPIGSSGVVIS